MTYAKIIRCLALYECDWSVTYIAATLGVSVRHVHWAISMALRLRRLTGENRQA